MNPGLVIVGLVALGIVVVFVVLALQWRAEERARRARWSDTPSARASLYDREAEMMRDQRRAPGGKG